MSSNKFIDKLKFFLKKKNIKTRINIETILNESFNIGSGYYY